jgi:hypothetical protein
MQIDLDKLAKLLNLTMSDNDHEALLAVRKANLILIKLNIHWDQVFRLTIEPEPKMKQCSKEEKEIILKIFDNLIPILSGSSLEFVSSLLVYFNEYGNLTKKQGETLVKIYKRHFPS